MHMRDTAFLAALLYAVNPAKAQHATQAVAHRIAIAAHDLPRGTVLSAADISWTDDSAAVATARSFTRSKAGKVSAVAPGWVTRRPIRAGEPLAEPGVSRPDLVTSGDEVDVVYDDDGVSIKLRGIAIGNGAQGDPVYVKLDNRRRLRGVVESASTVRIL
jgi:flagella basal body P-ring formation protein FlgA